MTRRHPDVPLCTSRPIAGGVRLRIQWRSLITVIGAALCGLLIVLAKFAWGFPNTAALGAPMAAVLIALSLVAGYVGLALVVNSTHVGIGRATISVHMGPLPWPGRTVVPSPPVTSLACVERSQEVGDEHGYQKDRTISFFEVHVVLETGQRVRLVPMLLNMEQALWVIEEVEIALDL